MDSRLNAKLADLETGGLSLDGSGSGGRESDNRRSGNRGSTMGGSHSHSNSHSNSNGMSLSQSNPSFNFSKSTDYSKSRFDTTDDYIHTFPVIAATCAYCTECLGLKEKHRTGTGSEILSNVGITPSKRRSIASVHNPTNTANVLPHWMAPEVFTNMSFYSQASDIYSLGVVL